MNKNINNFKKDFPIFTNNPDLIYLDSAATSQKPQQVIDAVHDFYQNYNSNVHRGIYNLSQKATDIYENSRKKVVDFIGASDPSEIIFTGNTTEALNLVAYGYAEKYLNKDDVIVLSEMEHHSNIVPWLRLKEKKGIQLFFIPIDNNFQLNYQLLNGLDNKKIKLVTLTHASNVLGTINPIEKIVSYLKKKNVKARILIDAAQSVPHFSVNVKKLDCDFLAFSSHKTLGPSGVGVLWAKKELLEEMDPLLTGGHMILQVTKDTATWADIPDKFEAGTGMLEGVAGLGAAIDYIRSIGIENIQKYEEQLTEYALDAFSSLRGLDFYGNNNPGNRLGVFSFNIKGIHPHDVGEILNRDHICVRTGHHCAQPLLKALNVPSTVRASLYLYNTIEDIDKLIEDIEKVKKVFKV